MWWFNSLLRNLLTADHYNYSDVQCCLHSLPARTVPDSSQTFWNPGNQVNQVKKKKICLPFLSPFSQDDSDVGSHWQDLAIHCIKVGSLAWHCTLTCLLDSQLVGSGQLWDIYGHAWSLHLWTNHCQCHLCGSDGLTRSTGLVYAALLWSSFSFGAAQDWGKNFDLASEVSKSWLEGNIFLSCWGVLLVCFIGRVLQCCMFIV